MSKPYSLTMYEKSYVHGQIMLAGAVNAYFEQGHVSQQLIERMIEVGRFVEIEGGIGHLEGTPVRGWKFTPAGVEWAYASGLLDASEIAEAKATDARFGKPVQIVESTPKAEDKAASDNPQATLPQVIKVAAKQDRVHHRDVSFIMDHLSVRECRALVTHQGFKPDVSLAWAIKIGLILENGDFTAKGHAFIGAIS